MGGWGAISRCHLYGLPAKQPALLPAVAPPGRLLGKGRVSFPFSPCRLHRGRGGVVGYFPPLGEGGWI